MARIRALIRDEAAPENFRSRFNRVFHVESNGLYCPLPKSPVLSAE